MKISFATNLYDKDGDMYEQCILLFLGDERAIIKFKSIEELRDFAREIEGHVIPEILENCSDELEETNNEN